MKRRARGAALLAALGLAACASLPPGAVSGDVLGGRLAVRVDAAGDAPARSESAAFELQGDPRRGRLDLSTPLGSMVAQARWDADSVLLVTPQGERRFADLDALTREVLGESVPVAALFDWLRGRPWPGAQSTENAAPAPRGFTQLGWSVDLARFDEGWVVAHRAGPPAVTVRARLERS